MRTRVAIVGAGVGGLAAAAALEARGGFEVAVYEQAPELRQQGSGLSLYTNAVAALRDLGLEGVLKDTAEPMERMLALSSEGRVLTEVDLEHTARRFSASNVNVHRGELLAALREALPEARGGAGGEKKITFGARCVGFEQEVAGVRLRFADGTERPADVLVAADGAGSVISRSIHGPEDGKKGRRWAGWQGVAASRPAGVPEGACLFVLSGRAVAGLLPLTGGRLHWFVDDPSVFGSSPDKAEGNPASGSLEEVIEGWPQVVREAVAGTPPGAVTYDRVRDRLPSRQWGRGRVTLLGDAAHPMLPALGQGACQSIEDAAALVASLVEGCLETATDPVAALRGYERVRSARAAAFVRASRRSSDFRSRVPPPLRDALMRVIPRRFLSSSFGSLIAPR